MKFLVIRPGRFDQATGRVLTKLPWPELACEPGRRYEGLALAQMAHGDVQLGREFLDAHTWVSATVTPPEPRYKSTRR